MMSLDLLAKRFVFGEMEDAVKQSPKLVSGAQKTAHLKFLAPWGWEITREFH